MRDRSPRIGPRPALLAAAALIVVMSRLRAQTDPDEVRAIWILGLSGSLASPSVDAMAEVILFSYDSLTGSSSGPEFLAQLGHAAFLH